MALADSKPPNPPDAHCEPPQAPEATHVARTCQEVLVPGLGPAIWDKTQGDVMGGHGQGTPSTGCTDSTDTAGTAGGRFWIIQPHGSKQNQQDSKSAWIYPRIQFLLSVPV